MTRKLLPLTLALMITSLFSAGCAPSFRGIRSEEVQQVGVKYSFKFEKSAVLEAFSIAARQLGYSVDSIDDEQGVITGTTPWSAFSYGERFAIQVEQASFDASNAYIVSDLLMKTNVFADATQVRRDLVTRAQMLLKKR